MANPLDLIIPPLAAEGLSAVSLSLSCAGHNATHTVPL